MAKNRGWLVLVLLLGIVGSLGAYTNPCPGGCNQSLTEGSPESTGGMLLAPNCMCDYNTHFLIPNFTRLSQKGCFKDKSCVLTSMGSFDGTAGAFVRPQVQGTSLPGACAFGDHAANTTQGLDGFYICTAANTWTRICMVGGTCGGGVTTTSTSMSTTTSTSNTATTTTSTSSTTSTTTAFSYTCPTDGTLDSAKSDEFNGSAPDGKWSWRNQGSNTVTESGGVETLTVSNSSVSCRMETAQSLPLSIRARVAQTCAGSTDNCIVNVLVNNETFNGGVGNDVDTLNASSPSHHMRGRWISYSEFGVVSISSDQPQCLRIDVSNTDTGCGDSAGCVTLYENHNQDSAWHLAAQISINAENAGPGGAVTHLGFCAMFSATGASTLTIDYFHARDCADSGCGD